MRAGFTQFEVMLKLGFYSTVRLSKWEQGHQLLNLINLFKLVKIYDVTLKRLFPDLAKNPSRS